MENKPHVLKQLGITHPLVQAPMLGVTTPHMVAAANAAGALGSLALGDLPPSTCEHLIQTTRQLTDKPFAVNLFVHRIPVLTDDLRLRYDQTKALLVRIAHKHGLNVSFPEASSLEMTDYHEQVEVILAAGCKVLSFTFGCLDSLSIDRCKEAGAWLMGTCTSVEEALFLENAGVDIIVVQGVEAGGHRGSFLGDFYPEIGGLSLLGQVREQSKLPLIYAGGIYNGSTARAAQELGACAVQVGSLLLRSRESALQPFEKDRLEHVREKDIILTNAFTGRLARGIKNSFVDLLSGSADMLPYPYLNKLTQPLRKAAKESANVELVSIWRGQSLSSLSDHSTKDILENLWSEIDEQHIAFHS
ncbi:NAD(P)H-dependent flavin oxidoreductase [Sphingobacterium suaedae]|uniref:Propionate 3-nitronate monooxygenase n=1 Tax=Sphingobacterium suaedae TaxID=1686402 RepID=A0ABW5KH96_9SPHI